MSSYADYTENRRKLEEEIAKLEETASVDVEKPKLPSVKLDEKVYDAPTDDELLNRAETSLADYKRQNENAIRGNSAAEADELAAKRSATEKELDGSLRALGEAYEKSARAIDNDVIKRGLARSSVAVTSKKDLEGEYLGKTADIRADYGTKIAELDGLIASVDGKLKAALDDFNLSYAVKLGQTLDGLKAEREKKLEEVIEYNNGIKQKQATLDANKAKTESDLYTAAIKQYNSAKDLNNLTDKERDEVYRNVYNTLDAFLGSLSKPDAQREVRNYSLYRDHLSDKYFYMLYDKYGR